MNEFQLWWKFKDQFPLHFIVCKQFASDHLFHTRPTSSRSSCSPARWPLADPNLAPEHLTCKYSKVGKAFMAGASDEEGSSSG